MEKDLIILAIYINTKGLTGTDVDMIMFNFIKQHENMYKGVNKDIKVYYFPSNETKIECIYPFSTNKDSVIENELLKIYKLFLNSKDGEAKELISHIEKKLKINKLFNKLKK